MNTIIIIFLVLPILLGLGGLFIKFTEEKLFSAAFGNLVIALIFLRTAIARISGGEVPESSLLAHPDNDWLRFITTSEIAYGVLHFLLAVCTIWFYIESSHKTRTWQISETKRVRGIIKVKTAQAHKQGSAETEQRLFEEYQLDSFKIDLLKLDNLKVENLSINGMKITNLNGKPLEPGAVLEVNRPEPIGIDSANVNVNVNANNLNEPGMGRTTAHLTEAGPGAVISPATGRVAGTGAGAGATPLKSTSLSQNKQDKQKGS